MKKSLFAVSLLLFAAVLLLAQATKNLEVKGNRAKGKSATYTMFPVSSGAEALLNARESGCYCGSNKVIFSPTVVTTPANTPVTIRYDATKICHGQGIADTNGNPYPPPNQIGNLMLGNVQWEVGALSDLPLEYGIVTYSGYAQPTQEKIQFTVQLRCLDTPHNKRNGEEVCGAAGYNVCTATGTIPVTVQ